MHVCVWKGVVSTRLTGLVGTAPAEAYHFDSNGMHIYFYEGHSIDKFFFQSLEGHQFRTCQSTSFSPFNFLTCA